MSYQIVWQPFAFERMAGIIRAYPGSKDRLAAALRELAAVLGSSPEDAGESREGDDRIAFFGPLVVTFRPDPAAGRVLVLTVRPRPLLL